MKIDDSELQNILPEEEIEAYFDISQLLDQYGDYSIEYKDGNLSIKTNFKNDEKQAKKVKKEITNMDYVNKIYSENTNNFTVYLKKEQ
jgi:hypothetical protein